jgi:hypothetical protein
VTVLSQLPQRRSIVASVVNDELLLHQDGVLDLVKSGLHSACLCYQGWVYPESLARLKNISILLASFYPDLPNTLRLTI